MSRNEYLLRLGITGIWFERGQFEYVEDMLRLARNELRYRGVMPSIQNARSKGKEPFSGGTSGLINKLWKVFLR